MHWNLQLSQSCRRLSSSRRNLHISKCLKKLFPVEASLHDIEHGAHTYACQKDDKIELAAQKAGCKLQSFSVRFEPNLAHRGHNNRFAAVCPDELFNLFRTAGLQ